MRFQVMVHGITGDMVTIDLCNTEEEFKKITVLQLKEKIIEKLIERGCYNNGAGDDLRLIFTTKSLDEDSALLCEYGIQRRSVIMVVLRVPGGGGIDPGKGDGGMGDKEGKNRSMETLSYF